MSELVTNKPVIARNKNEKGYSLVALPYQSGPILNGAGHVSAEDVIILSLGNPISLDIVDHELHIRRHPENASQ